MLGGNAWVSAIAFAAAVCIDRLQLVMNRRRLPFFYQQVAGGAVATLLAAGAEASPLQLDPSLVVTANIIMLLAGVGFMGALQDALSGFYLTAGARLTEALLATAGIIAGVSGGLTIADVIGIHIGDLEPGLGHQPQERHRGGAGCRDHRGRVRVLVVRAPPDHRADRGDRRGGHDDLAVVDDPRLRPHLADRHRGVRRRPGQLHRRRPAAGAAPGRGRLGGRADAARASRSTAGCPCSPRAAPTSRSACCR